MPAAEPASPSRARALPFALRPHPALPAPAFVVSGEIECRPGGLVVRYAVRGDLGRLRLPPPMPPAAADDLWKHTCLELFVAGDEGAGYREFNFSPSSQWASYAFADYRVRDAAPPSPPPVVDCRVGADALALRATLPAAALPPGDWRLGVAAVLETRDGDLSWWALHHPAARPDFHHRDGFVLALTERP